MEIMWLTPAEKKSIKNLFNNNGYVLDFSSEEFDNFTEECVGVRLIEYYNCSQRKAFEKYIDEAEFSKVIILIEELLKYAIANDVFFIINNANSIDLCKHVINRYKSSLVQYGKNQQPKEPLVFFSHTSKDKKYGDALRDLLIGLGVQKKQLIYTSHPLHDIPAGENIFEYLRKNIHTNVFMIFLLSDEYFESVACLNEMVAAWVSKSDYLSVFVPGFDFNNPKFKNCVIDDKNMGVNLSDSDCKFKVLELKNKIKNIFKLPSDEQNENYLVDKFIGEILNIQKDD